MTEDRQGNETEIVTKVSPRSVADTVSRLTDMIDAKGMKHFAVIDQSAEADSCASRRTRAARSGLVPQVDWCFIPASSS